MSAAWIQKALGWILEWILPGQMSPGRGLEAAVAQPCCTQPLRQGVVPVAERVDEFVEDRPPGEWPAAGFLFDPCSFPDLTPGC